MSLTAVSVSAFLLLGSGCQMLQMKIADDLPTVPFGTPNGVAASVYGPRAAQLMWTPPQTVKGLKATSHEVRCVPLTWDASPEPDVVRYDIYQARDPGGPFNLAGSAQGLKATSFMAGGGNPGNLEDEGKYCFSVRAVNAVTAESADSEIVQAVTRDIPPEVSQITAVSARPREVPLSWQPSPDVTVTGYELWRAIAGSDDWAQVARINGRESVSYLDRGGEKDPAKLGQLK
ncbi:MAG: hypothetical protein PHG71_07175, partial [Kiritimatiellae bacterium]|nr:hypothetical protein [Kiritimatiellia bacterium]